MSKADKYLKRLRDRCETLKARTGQQWEQELHALEWAIQRIERQSETQGRIKFVPLQPTKAMIQAGAETGCFIGGDEDINEWRWRQSAETVYKAMINASPSN